MPRRRDPAGVRVLAVEQMAALPLATQLMARLGAELVKLEHPERGESGRASNPGITDPDGRHVGATFLRNNLGKSSVGLDLKSAEGVEIFLGLVPRFDVVAENFRAGTADRLGIAYDAVREVHPDVVCLSVSGFGHDPASPYVDRSAYTAIVEGISGIYEYRRRPGRPPTANPVERAHAFNTLAATENGNPLYWDTEVAARLTDGPTMPLTTLSLWMRPHFWQPGAEGEQLALQVHFDLKRRLGLPEAIMSDNTLVFHEPVRPGDIISHHQILRSIRETKTTRLGTGRFWVIDVEYMNQRNEIVGVESYTGFGYRRPDDSVEVAA